jgi:hypothetical protein
MGLKPRTVWQDRQVAEDKSSKTFASLVNHQARFVGTLLFVRSIKANPSKGGDAKPWVLSHVLCGKIARLPKANHWSDRFAGSA